MTRRDSLDLSTGDPVIPPMSPEVVRRAALAVCDAARDPDDAAMLLDALGLVDDHRLTTLGPVSHTPLGNAVQFGRVSR